MMTLSDMSSSTSSRGANKATPFPRRSPKSFSSRVATPLGSKSRDKASDLARAVVHQLLAARAHDWPDLGAPAKAALYRKVTLEIAIKAKLAEPLS